MYMFAYKHGVSVCELWPMALQSSQFHKTATQTPMSTFAAIITRPIS